MAEADPQKTFNVDDASTDLSALVARAHAGEEIVLAKAGVPYAKLVPYSGEAPPRRTPGRYKDALRNLSHDAVLAPSYTDAELAQIENARLFPSP